MSEYVRGREGMNERTNNLKNERLRRILRLNTDSDRSRVIHCKRVVYIRATFTLEEFQLLERGDCLSEKSTEVIVVSMLEGRGSIGVSLWEGVFSVGRVDW